MAIPKAKNEHITMNYMNFSRKEIIRPNSHKTHGFDHIMTIFPRNSPDNYLFGHVTTKSTYLTKIHEFHVFSALKFNSSTPSYKKSSASQISANPTTCTQLIH